MVSHRSRYISESTSDDDQGDMEYTPNNQQTKPGRKPTRTPKCFSKNALMARENRLKKKVYITTLENQVSSVKNENKNLSAIVENQSFMINELKKQVKYLKSVISNSPDIGRLIRAINSSTGMAVSTSLENQLAVNTGTVTKSPFDMQQDLCTHTISETGDGVPNVWEHKMYMGDSNTRHPWEENGYNSFPTPESIKSHCSSFEFDHLNNDILLPDLDIPLEINKDNLLEIVNDRSVSPIAAADDHNYHNPIIFEENDKTSNDDVGVCLHVTKNKVSLEFCPTCSDNALHNSLFT